MLFCWENGKSPHPDTITRRFKRLAAVAALPEIDLHDVRDSCTTAGRDAKIDWKGLGPADRPFGCCLASRNWNDVYVHSDQPDTPVTASADGYSHTWDTESSGYADVYLDGPPPGVLITVTVGGETCTASD
ncbi:MAG: hypothetical protein ABSA53_27545 [Streptosporangiaceae bacterium]